MKKVRIAVVRTDDKGVKKISETLLVFKISKGFSYIAEIIANPGEKIPNQMLAGERCSMRTVPEEITSYDRVTGAKLISNRYDIGYGEKGIELTDRKTVSDCMDRINRLNTKLAALQSEGMLTVSTKEIIENEVGAIVNYLHETYDFSKRKYRLSRTDSKRICQAIKMAVRRAIIIIETRDNAVAALLRTVINIDTTHAIYTPERNISIEITFIA